MKSLKSILIAASLTATSATMVNAQPKGTAIERDAKRKVTNAETTPVLEPSEYRELRCRGGAGLRFVTVEGGTSSTGEKTMYQTVSFQLGAQASDAFGRNLQPGQCAFPERALRSDEPDQIVQEIVYFGQLRQQLNGSAVDNSATAAERFPDAQNLPLYLSDPKHYWSF